MSRRTFPENLDDLGLELQDLNHKEAISRFAAYLANDMPLQQQAELVKHIRGCGICHDKLFALELHLRLAAKDLA